MQCIFHNQDYHLHWSLFQWTQVCHDCLSDYNGKGLSVYHDFMPKRYAQYEFAPLNVPFVPCTVMIFLS